MTDHVNEVIDNALQTAVLLGKGWRSAQEWRDGILAALAAEGLVIVPRERLCAISWALGRGNATQEEIDEMRDVLNTLAGPVSTTMLAAAGGDDAKA